MQHTLDWVLRILAQGIRHIARYLDLLALIRQYLSQ